MNYAEKAEVAQQEQLDWLSQIAEEGRKQTELLRTIARHTGLIYALAIAGCAFLAIYVLTVSLT